MGMFLWERLGQRRVSTTETHRVEVPIFIPGKVVTLPGKPIVVIDSSRSAREDSLIAALTKQGSLDSLARWRGQRFSATFEDTLAVKDSLGEFYTREIHTVNVDGATQLIGKAVKYLDSKLVGYKTTTTVTEYGFDYLVSAIVLLVGVILGLVL